MRLGKHRANVIIECFMKTESHVAVQHKFCKKFKLKRHDLFLLCVTINKLVKTLWETSATTSVGVVGRKRSVQTAKNCEKLSSSQDGTTNLTLSTRSSLCFPLNVKAWSLLSPLHSVGKKSINNRFLKRPILIDFYKTNVDVFEDTIEIYSLPLKLFLKKFSF